MKFDFHSHTSQQDGKNSAREMVEAAIEKGLDIYGISEHSPRPEQFRYADDPKGKTRGLEGWEDFLTEVEKLKEEFRDKIELLKGCEVDWLGKENIAWTKDFLQKGNFDYTIGSVHFLGKWGFDYIEDWEAGFQDYESVEEVYQKYFSAYAQMVDSGLFDIAGHLDLIKKFQDKYPLPESVSVLELAKPALDALEKSDMVLEVSSAGLRKPCQECYPGEELLTEAFKKGIPITISSDAHSVKAIADKFEETREFVKTIGYSEVVVFHQSGERGIIKI